MTVITPGVAPGSAARREPPAPVLVAALASAGAGLIHAAAAGVHAEHRSMAWLFAACAVVQLGWAVLVVARPARLLLVAGALFQVACVGVWALSRTAGWPVVESMRDGEAAGYPDSAAAAMAAVAAAAAGVAVLRPAARRAGLPLLALGSVVVLALAMPAMAAPHDHLVDEHADTHADDLVLDTVGEDAAAPGDGWGHDHGDPVGGADGPIVSLDDPRLSPEQRERAGSLIDVTTAAMAAFPDQAAVEAAGYRSIGDGGRATSTSCAGTS
ncbi:MAG: hypothetical protein M5U14_20240 [Acidimicrobiia bacterium]|nr:hypothetical protein [Acidimicrobiia bacterium]